jgi:hypothetical protein
MHSTRHADESFRRGTSLASRQAALENEGVRASVDRKVVGGGA